MLQRRDYHELYLGIAPGFTNPGQEYVRMEYAIRLFNSALERKYYATALLAYNLITLIEKVITPNEVPAVVFTRGDLLLESLRLLQQKNCKP